MAQVWLIELLKGIGKLFLHPVFYYLLFLSAVLGVMRVKRERKNFHVRAHNAYYELRQLFPLGLVIGLILSVLSVAIGITVPFAAVVLIAAFTIIWSITANIRLMSPAYTIGAAFFTLIIMAEKKWSIPLVPNVNENVYPSITVLLAILLIAEGILIYKNGCNGSSPKLIKGKRGKNVGVHEVKRVWMVPLFLLIPGNALQLPFEWWPVFHIGAEKYSLMFVPFAIGFHQQIQGMLPKEAIQLYGRQVIILGSLTAILSIAGYWYPLIAIIVAALAVIGRELLCLIQRLRDDSLPAYFSKKNKGLMILGVIPESPASKMGLQVGELISKANGTIIRNEEDFYEALQKNRAHCKLEVFDTKGEVRFVQRALFEGDHYQLGILFVQDEPSFESKASLPEARDF